MRKLRVLGGTGVGADGIALLIWNIAAAELQMCERESMLQPFLPKHSSLFDLQSRSFPVLREKELFTDTR
jgi:hypothetical protein